MTAASLQNIICTGKFLEHYNKDTLTEWILKQKNFQGYSIKDFSQKNLEIISDLSMEEAQSIWEELRDIGVVCKITSKHHLNTDDEKPPSNTADEKKTSKPPSNTADEKKTSKPPSNTADEEIQQDNQITELNPTPFKSYLSKYKGLITSIIILLSIGAYSYNKYFTQKGMLITQWKTYNEFIKDNNAEGSFGLLTPNSRKNYSWDIWEKFIISSSNIIEDEIHTIKIKTNGTTALLGITQTGSTSSGVRGYLQTWELIEGVWYRAHFQDNPNTGLALIQPEKHEENKDTFVIIKLKEKWDIQKTQLSSQVLYRPELSFSVLNTSTNLIKELYFKVQWIEIENNRVFSSDNVYAISTSDIPLKPEFESETFFFKSNIGLEITNEFMQGLSGDSSNTYVQNLLNHSKKYKPTLFYKVNGMSQWIEHGMDE